MNYKEKLSKYAIYYLSKYSSSKKNLEYILKKKIRRLTEDKKIRFELYEEIWDYTFDSINAHDERWTKLLDQVNVISKEGIDYNLIKEKLEYNQSIFLNKDNHKITIRNILKQIDNLYI